ncbi:hypothetical protein [Paenibacillus sp. CH40]|uniref:hypothetical protein n=1 Tax=Paenibacillus sp. CH40 TaxID=2962045 RepID=UPI0020B658F8|nr:hypothetical protein [Paenibacillus sp. CH40]MCP3795036.1 hypothetical protein [Paenibacillus sp. CH40]
MRILLFLLLLLLCITLDGCANFQSESDRGSSHINDINSSGSFQIELEQLKSKLSNIKSEDLKSDIRQSNLEQFTSGLVALMNMQDSTKIKGDELSDILDETVVSSTKVVVLKDNKLNVRVINFQAPIDLKGTLENNFTIIQWWNDEGHVRAQLVLNEDAQKVTDFVVSTYKGKVELLLGGYLSLYSPKPVFVSSWELDNQKWSEKNHSFTNIINSTDFWDLSIEDNTLTVENQQHIEMNIGISENMDGFLITSDMVPNVIVQFSRKGVEIYQEFKSSNVDGEVQRKIDHNQYAIDKSQSFTTNLNGWGEVKFVSATRDTNGLNQASFFLLDNAGTILYTLPEFSGNNNGMLEGVKAISFKDVNHDGYSDIVIIGEYITGAGPQGVVPFPIADIYFQKKNKTFTTIPTLDEALNDQGHNQTIKDVIQYVSKQRINVN